MKEERLVRLEEGNIRLEVFPDKRWIKLIRSGMVFAGKEINTLLNLIQRAMEIIYLADSDEGE